MTPISCRAYRVNGLRYEAENRYVGSLNIQPQTFCSLVEIKEVVMGVITKSQTMGN